MRLRILANQGSSIGTIRVKIHSSMLKIIKRVWNRGDIWH